MRLLEFLLQYGWFLFPLFGTTCTAAFNQKAFRGRNDDGDETTATWQANQNVAWLQKVDTNFRIRLEVQETAGCAKANFTTIQLQYNLAGAGWVNVTATSNVVRSSASPNLADGANTTNQLTVGTGTFVGGGGFDEVNGIAGNTNMDIAASGHFEVEYCVQLRSADVVAGQVVQLRVTDGGVAFAAYDATASLNVNETIFIDVFDDVHPTEDVTVFQRQVVPGASDDVTVTDGSEGAGNGLILIITLPVSAGDDVTVAEDVTVVLITADSALSVTAFDDVTVAEDVTLFMTVFLPDNSDDVTITEDVIVLLENLVSLVSDDVTLIEFVTVAITPLLIDAFDDVAVTDDNSLVLVSGVLSVLSIDVFEELTVTDDVVRLTSQYKGVRMFQWEAIG